MAEHPAPSSSSSTSAADGNAPATGRATVPHHRRGILICLAALAALPVLLAFDVSLMRWRFRVMPEPPLESVQQILLGFQDFAQLIPLLVVVVIVAAYDRRRRWMIATLIGSQVLANVVYNSTKYVVARHRPLPAVRTVAELPSLTVFQTWIGWRPGNRSQETQSFPSGHSAAAFALAAVLARFYPKLGWMFWTLAVGCAASRYLTAAHWPSDCLAGAVLGYLAAWLSLRWPRLAGPYAAGGLRAA